MGPPGRGKGALQRQGGEASANALQTKETGVVGYMVELVQDHGPRTEKQESQLQICATANLQKRSLRTGKQMRLQEGLSVRSFVTLRVN